jgi:hypothetical protein
MLIAAQEGHRAERHGDVERATDVGTEKSGVRDADDGEGDAVERDRLADDILRATEPALPEVVPEHRHGAIRAAPAPVVGVGERAADDGAHAEHFEHPATRTQSVHRVHLAAL